MSDQFVSFVVLSRSRMYTPFKVILLKFQSTPKWKCNFSAHATASDATCLSFPGIRGFLRVTRFTIRHI